MRPRSVVRIPWILDWVNLVFWIMSLPPRIVIGMAGRLAVVPVVSGVVLLDPFIFGVPSPVADVVRSGIHPLIFIVTPSALMVSCNVKIDAPDKIKYRIKDTK